MKKLSITFLTISCFSLSAYAQEKEEGLEVNDTYTLRCEALVKEDQAKLIIKQDYDFAGKADTPVSATLLPTRVTPENAAVDLNKNKYTARQHYLRIEATKPVLAALSVVNDGVEEFLSVEYSAKDRKNSRIVSISYDSEGKEVRVEASGEAVECSIENKMPVVAPE